MGHSVAFEGDVIHVIHVILLRPAGWNPDVWGEKPKKTPNQNVHRRCCMNHLHPWHAKKRNQRGGMDLIWQGFFPGWESLVTFWIYFKMSIFTMLHNGKRVHFWKWCKAYYTKFIRSFARNVDNRRDFCFMMMGGVLYWRNPTKLKVDHETWSHDGFPTPRSPFPGTWFSGEQNVQLQGWVPCPNCSFS